MSPRLLAALLLTALALLASCRVGPDPVPPEAQGLPETWARELPQGHEADPQLLLAWWKELDDPVLTALVERVLDDNLEIAQALERLRESRALHRASGGALVPSLGFSARYDADRSSETVDPPGATAGKVKDLYATGFDASWELDLFGGLHRAREASAAELGAAREDLHGVLVSLLSETALAYVELRLAEARLDVALRNRATQERTLAVVRARVAAGIALELDRHEAEVNLRTTRALVPGLRANVDAQKNRIAVLCGTTPGRLDALLDEGEEIPTVPEMVAVGLPADLLRRRPDLRRLEHLLLAATARIGVRKAELLPKFRLTGLLDLESGGSDNLLDGRSLVWRLAPRLDWSLFTGHRDTQLVEAARARAEELRYAWQDAVLRALEEVETALLDIAAERERHDLVAEALRSARERARLSRRLYEEDLTDFSNVLDAERSLLDLEEDAAISRATRTINHIRLHKALGGGWQTTAARLTRAGPPPATDVIPR